MPRYYRMGGTEENGAKKTPFVLNQDGEKTKFVVFCRKCHIGLCRGIEIGNYVSAEGKLENVMAVEPHVCGETLDWPERYLGALAEAI